MFVNAPTILEKICDLSDLWGNVLFKKEKENNYREEHTLSLTANRKLLKANPSLTSVTGDHHGVQCVNNCYVISAYSLQFPIGLKFAS
ncbi:hypothetical protein SFRURICE_020738 [Spodoptera frugiperda]|nr:hypothetical protein SFRURICE_020738 [Spodoptera frugiperda]